jgi:lysophospholipase L1-like esterase
MQLTDGPNTDDHYIEILDASDNVLVTVRCYQGLVRFNTNVVGITTLSFSENLFKQVVLGFNHAQSTVGCYVSCDYVDISQFGLLQVGNLAAFTGTPAKVRFTKGTTTAVRSFAVPNDDWIFECDFLYAAAQDYVGNVKAYATDVFLIGDSISQGVWQFENNPSSPTCRHVVGTDWTANPAYQLGLLLDPTGNSWVANRGFGGSPFSAVSARFQAHVANQNAKRLIILGGTNDLEGGLSLSAMQNDFNNLIAQANSMGLTGNKLMVGNVFPCLPNITGPNESTRLLWNAWIANRAVSYGWVFVDRDLEFSDGQAPPSIKSQYAAFDFIHLNKAGYVRMAAIIYAAMTFVASRTNAPLRVHTANGGIEYFYETPGGALRVATQARGVRQFALADVAGAVNISTSKGVKSLV